MDYAPWFNGQLTNRWVGSLSHAIATLASTQELGDVSSLVFASLTIRGLLHYFALGIEHYTP